MKLFEWDEKFSVGMEEIDDQHKKLIDMINDLSDAMSAGKSKEVMGDILKGLVQYGVIHFDTEEKLFKRYNYENSAEHIKQHEGFKKEATKLLEEYEAGSFKVSLETLMFLKDWVINHIKKQDLQYKGKLQ